MRVMPLIFSVSPLLLFLTSCLEPPEPPPRTIQFYQNWQLQPGTQVSGYRVVSGLGNIMLALQGKPVYAPFAGRVERNTEDCVLYSSPEVPAYLFRLCGLQQIQIGEVNAQQPLGKAENLQISALRKQPDGRWAFVEPAPSLLTKMLQSP